MSSSPLKPRYPRTDLFSVSDLATRPGWTRTAMKRFLGEPDDTRPNPHARTSGPPMRLWLRSRVHTIEAMPEFQAWLVGHRRRSGSALMGVETKVAKMVAAVKEAKLWIVRGVSDESIRRRAESHAYAHGRNFEFTVRAARATIRHELTNYEACWDLLNRGETGAQGYQELRERIDELIDEAYPHFRVGADDPREAGSRP